MKTQTPTFLPRLRGIARTSAARTLLLLAAGLSLGMPQVHASSHSDAPLIKQDPQANLTDVYAFIRQRPSGEQVLVVEVSVRPFSEPGDGVVYDRFADDASYNIHIADPVTGRNLMRYSFRFSDANPVTPPGLKNPNTILSYGRGTEVGPIVTVGDARQNYTQTYRVQLARPGLATLTLARDLMVPPPNVGLNTTPSYNDPMTGLAVSGATSRALLDPYTFQTTYDVPRLDSQITVFAGPREDGFYADTPGIFDLLDSRIIGSTLGQGGNGVDGFKGFNVLHYGIVIPLSQLPSIAYTGALQPASTGVGVYATVSRPRVSLRPSNITSPTATFVQVNRLANPLFNEVLVSLGKKDLYNRTLPTTDSSTFGTFAETPELAFLLNTVFGTSFVTTGRADLKAIYIPDVIRVNTTTGPTRVAGEAGFSRLSFIGGDTIANGAGTQIPAGWPNGRRFGDDVVDIALTAIASGPSFSTTTIVGDNAPANDQVYNRTFPYAATPHAGARNTKDSGPNVTPAP